MAAEQKSPGRDVLAKRVQKTQKRAESREWVREEFRLALIIVTISGAIIAFGAFAAAHLVYWLQHLGR